MGDFNSNGNETLNSTTLAALVVPANINPGTKIWNVGVGAFFTYTSPSSASLVTDQVVAVAGITGARWIIDSVAAGSVGTTQLVDGAVTLAKLSATLQAGGWTVATTTQDNTDITISSLDMNAALGYEFYVFWPAGCAGVMSLAPNNDTAHATTVAPYGLWNGATATTAAFKYDFLYLMNGGDTADWTHFTIAGKTGNIKLFEARTFYQNGALQYVFNANGIFTQTANVTSLVIHNDTSSGTKTGTTYMYRPLKLTT